MYSSWSSDINRNDVNDVANDDFVAAVLFNINPLLTSTCCLHMYHGGAMMIVWYECPDEMT